MPLIPGDRIEDESVARALLECVGLPAPVPPEQAVRCDPEPHPYYEPTPAFGSNLDPPSPNEG